MGVAGDVVGVNLNVLLCLFKFNHTARHNRGTPLNILFSVNTYYTRTLTRRIYLKSVFEFKQGADLFQNVKEGFQEVRGPRDEDVWRWPG